MMRLKGLFVLTTAFVIIGCFDDSVRLYVDIDDSCSSCCDDQKFRVYVGGYEEATIEAGESTMVTRETGTGNEVLEIWIIDKGKKSTSSEDCQACIQSSIKESGDRLNSNGVYALYDDHISFVDKDLHAQVHCN